MAITGVLNGAIQTSWDFHPNQGVPGQLTYLNEPHDYIHCPIEAPFLAFGRGVAKGTLITNRANEWGTTVSPFHLAAPTASTTAANIVGILAWNTSGGVGPNPVMQGTEADAASGAFQREMGTLVRLGCIHVKNYADTTENGEVHMIINETNDWNAQIGEFVPAAASGQTILVPGLRWHSSDSHAMNATSVVKVNLLYGART